MGLSVAFCWFAQARLTSTRYIVAMANRSTLALAFGMGVVAGLRSMTPAAALSWGANSGRLKLQGSPLALLGSPLASRITSKLALGELVADKTPYVPNRISPASLSWRLIVGGVSGAAIAWSANDDAAAGAALGAAGALTGSFVGFGARRQIVRSGQLPDFAVALLEDLVAISGAVAVVSCAGQSGGWASAESGDTWLP